MASLHNGVLTDAQGRIGSIVANHQFQFDGPPAQEGAIYTGGWSVCSNGSLALGPSAVFYECLSGTFYNLYNTPAGASCMQVLIQVLPCGAGAGATQGSDGQPNANSATKAATQITDGQVQATSAGPKATQISDGQIQASSAQPKPVSQFTDGQIQVTGTPSKVAPVTQISDGQVQASATTTGKPVSQISDGQIQASASTSAASKVPVSQAPEGQVQATTASSASKSTTAAPSPATFTGSASMVSTGAQLMAAAVAAVAVVLL